MSFGPMHSEGAVGIVIVEWAARAQETHTRNFFDSRYSCSLSRGP